jgi:hypothetical protein
VPEGDRREAVSAGGIRTEVPALALAGGMVFLAGAAEVWALAGMALLLTVGAVWEA